jgi:2-C-methyl-D-erythritol 2,4-cyclodiphosphate synthase
MQRNLKLTTPEDFEMGERLLSGSQPSGGLRVGLGYDVHALVPGRPLVLGGVSVPHETGPAGHSDGDLICHAATDALLGAAGLPDIGQLFPDTDPAYAGAASLDLLARAGQRARQAGFRLVNLDVVLVAEAPRLVPHLEAMKTRGLRLDSEIGPLHLAKVQVLISLGGWGWDKQFAAMVSKPEAEDRYVKAVMTIVDDYDYDGIDLDWEYPDTKDEVVGYERLCRRFRQHLDELGQKKGRHFYQTMAAAANPPTLKWLSNGLLLETMDWVNVMCYDFDSGNRCAVVAGSSSERQPCAALGLVEASGQAVEVRAFHVQQMGEFVETDVETVVGVGETLPQRGHRQDHRAPGMGLAGQLRPVDPLGEPVEPGPRHVRVDPAGADRVHLDVLACQLGSEGADEPEQAGLGRGVAGVAGHRDPGEDRCDHDEVAGVRPWGEMAEGRTGRVVGAREIRRDEIVEAVFCAVGVRTAEPAVGDEGVDRAALGGRSRERRIDLPAVADVACRRTRADCVGYLAQPFEVAREKRQARTLRGEALGDRPPDPLATAGDDDMPARESLHRSPLSLFA